MSCIERKILVRVFQILKYYQMLRVKSKRSLILIGILHTTMLKKAATRAFHFAQRFKEKQAKTLTVFIAKLYLV